MNTPHSRHPLDSIGAHLSTGGHHYLVGPAVEMTPILLGLLSATVAIGIAITGWKLARRWRRIDNHRDDLTELAQLLRRIQVQIQLLADADTMPTVADSQILRTLKYELDGVDVSFAPEAADVVADVILRLDELLGEVSPHTGAVTLTRARAQGRAVQAALVAITAAQAVISRLRRR
ncbi:hypothetical protein [Streptomyces chartreusis]|uniref:hypothetical protein n=1 Tax=Streptomyces chartreusis TaxID=1969 RepID=UPI002F915F6A|nr:hypothetical protein OG938_47200 [Streptomyces chartreusis]WTA33610.1 hypothetical protein OIA45_47645 [Streptomyces chartreusis]